MDHVFGSTLKGKLKSPFKEKLKFEDGYLMLKLILKAGNGNRENPNSHCTETHQQLESQRRELLQAIQWADQAQRERERGLICVENWK